MTIFEVLNLFRVLLEMLNEEPVITITVVLAGFMFVKWVFAPHPDDRI
jgi:hypothetical protein